MTSFPLALLRSTRPEFIEHVHRDLRKDARAGVLQSTTGAKGIRIPRAGRHEVARQEASERRRRQDPGAITFARQEGRFDGVAKTPGESRAFASRERRILMEEVRGSVFRRIANRRFRI